MLVIIHGWSDTHESFRTLGNWLLQEGIVDQVRHVRLANYASLDDDVTFQDLVEALQAAWIKERLPTEPRSVDVVVHSTGGLVIRDWMTTHYRPDSNPVYRLLMLAPANFGSHLAHKGRSFLGRVVKGFKSDRPFQTGSHILKGLELASPYSSGLARKDLFGGTTWYGKGKVLCTVLVGTAGYSGISSVANQDGSDGTVLVSAANLNASRLTLDFSTNPLKPTARPMGARGETAFARMPGENHSTTAFKDKGPKHKKTKEFVHKALTVTDSSFGEHCKQLDQFSEEARKDEESERYTHGYQNTVVHLTDSQNSDVDDYFLEIFVKKTVKANHIEIAPTSRIQETVIATVHAYKPNTAYRSLLINCTELERVSSEYPGRLCIAITAFPEVQQTKSVGYNTFAWDAIESLKLSTDTRRQYFRPDRTVLVDFVVRRVQTDKVVQFKRLS